MRNRSSGRGGARRFNTRAGLYAQLADASPVERRRLCAAHSMLGGTDRSPLLSEMAAGSFWTRSTSARRVPQRFGEMQIYAAFGFAVQSSRELRCDAPDCRVRTSPMQICMPRDWREPGRRRVERGQTAGCIARRSKSRTCRVAFCASGRCCVGAVQLAAGRPLGRNSGQCRSAGRGSARRTSNRSQLERGQPERSAPGWSASGPRGSQRRDLDGRVVGGRQSDRMCGSRELSCAIHAWRVLICPAAI
jgi:hypothetical protein